MLVDAKKNLQLFGQLYKLERPETMGPDKLLGFMSGLGHFCMYNFRFVLS